MEKFESAVADLLSLVKRKESHITEMGMYTYTKRVIQAVREVSTMALQHAEDTWMRKPPRS